MFGLANIVLANIFGKQVKAKKISSYRLTVLNKTGLANIVLAVLLSTVRR